jgi:hypothetical protein
VLLAFDSERYLFNCGEGLQRLASESKVGVHNPGAGDNGRASQLLRFPRRPDGPPNPQVRLTRVKTILATRTHTDTLAGLPGVLLTLAPVGPEIAKCNLLDAEPLDAALIGEWQAAPLRQRVLAGWRGAPSVGGCNGVAAGSRRQAPGLP